MNEMVNQYYNELLSESAVFREFVLNMEKYSNDELVALYGLARALLRPVET